MNTFAASNWIALALGALSLLSNLALGLALYWVNAKAQRIGQLEAKTDHLQEELTHTLSKLVDERMATCRATHIGQLNEAHAKITEIKERLSAGETHFRNLDERHRELEIKIFKVVDEIKDLIRNATASKGDVTALAERVTRLRIAVVRASGQTIEEGD
jgi:chromosome segregation ATPase